MFLLAQQASGAIAGLDLQSLLKNPIVWIGIIGLILFFVLKPKPAPTPAPTPAKDSGPSVFDLSRLEFLAGQLHAVVSQVHASQERAAESGGQYGAIDPSAIINLVNLVIQFWPIIKLLAGLFGVVLPDLPIKPLPVPTPAPANAARSTAAAPTSAT